MKLLDRSLVVSLAALALSACSGEEKQPANSPPTAQPPAAGQAPAEDSAVDDVPALPSQAEADAKAAAEISKQNADLELEKIKKELGGG